MLHTSVIQARKLNVLAAATHSRKYELTGTSWSLDAPVLTVENMNFLPVHNDILTPLYSQ